MTQPQTNRLRPFSPMRFGRYTLVARLAQGGMGELFLAQLGGGAQGFQKLCVIKRMLPQLAHDPEFVERFTDEARVLVKLSHGSIAQVLELGTHEDSPFLALEYVDGKDLRRIAARARELNKPLPLGFVIQIMSRVLEALSYAHRKRDDDGRELQLVHRDISPPNILVSYEGEVKVIDFGLARSRLSAARTNPRSLLGKFLYMSPEQARHRPVDRRSDLYAVGLCLYELIAGAHPFEALPPAELMTRVAQPKVTPLHAVAPGCPGGLADIVMRALSPEPEARFQSADELRISLMAHLAGSDPFAGAESVSRTMLQLFASEYQLERKLLASARAPMNVAPQENRSRDETGIISVPALLAARQVTHGSPRPPPPPQASPAAGTPSVRRATPTYGTPVGSPAVQPRPGSAAGGPPALPRSPAQAAARPASSREHQAVSPSPTFEPTPLRLSPGSPGLLVPASSEGPTRNAPMPQPPPRDAQPPSGAPGGTPRGGTPQGDLSTRPTAISQPAVQLSATPVIPPALPGQRSPPPPPPEDEPTASAGAALEQDAEAALAAWFQAEPESEGVATETVTPPLQAFLSERSSERSQGTVASGAAEESARENTVTVQVSMPVSGANELPTPIPPEGGSPTPKEGARAPTPPALPTPAPPREALQHAAGDDDVSAAPTPPPPHAPLAKPVPSTSAPVPPSLVPVAAGVESDPFPPTPVPAAAASGPAVSSAPPIPLDVAARLARSVKQVSDPDRTPIPQVEQDPRSAPRPSQPFLAAPPGRAPAALDDLFQAGPVAKPTAAAYAAQVEHDPEATDPGFRLRAPEPVVEAYARRERRSLLWTSLIALVILGVIGGGAFEWWRLQQAEIDAERAAAAAAEELAAKEREAAVALAEARSRDMLAEQDAALAEGVLSVDTEADAAILIAPLRFERAVRRASSTRVERAPPPGQLGAEWQRTETLYKRLQGEGRCEAGLLLLCKRYLRVQERVLKATSDDETLRRQVVELRHALEQMGG